MREGLIGGIIDDWQGILFQVIARTGQSGCNHRYDS